MAFLCNLDDLRCLGGSGTPSSSKLQSGGRFELPISQSRRVIGELQAPR
jgi:hypothetical protein